MSNYSIGLQRAKGGYKVVLFSTDNGKLVLAGEVINSMQEAMETEEAIMDAWKEVQRVDDVFLASKKWPKNAGPAKKKAAKKTTKKK